MISLHFSFCTLNDLSVNLLFSPLLTPRPLFIQFQTCGCLTVCLAFLTFCFSNLAHLTRLCTSSALSPSKHAQIKCHFWLASLACLRPSFYSYPNMNQRHLNSSRFLLFDSEQDRCSRETCKYFHPPSHLKEQLLINGKNHLAMKNAMFQQMQLPLVSISQFVSQLF
jgi:hypothetical protein